MTSACPSLANMTGEPPNDRCAVLNVFLPTPANAATVRLDARENMMVTTSVVAVVSVILVVLLLFLVEEDEIIAKDIERRERREKRA